MVMDDESISLIVDEIAPILSGRAPGKIFQLSHTSLAVDFGLRDAGYLFISAEPATPRLYLIKRRVRDLEKQSMPLTPFALTLRKELANTRLTGVEKDAHDRVVWFTFAGEDDLGKTKTRNLVAQLTGRSANLLLVDDRKAIIHAMRASREGGMKTGDVLENSKPPVRAKKQSELVGLMRSGEHSPSETADRYFTNLSAEKAQAARIASARGELRRKISQQQKLLEQLERDLRSHANPDEQKRTGDLLLANLSTAKRDGRRVTLLDYFAGDDSTIELEIDESLSLQEEAVRRFAAFTRSKRAVEHIGARQKTVRARLKELETESESLESRIASGEFPSQDHSPTASGERPRNAARQMEPKRVPGTRRYLSSDGLEILVGRTSNDNDHLTFKIAKPNDLWLHAADYGGSHVVVRNSTRKEIPQRTLIEAAQLAAYFSQAKKNPKADVHYIERKFVSKIKGAKPGLVRLQRFKNITVVPKEAGTRV